MRENLNEKLDKHRWSILKLAEDSLIDGEVLISYKQKDGDTILYVISEERLKGISHSQGHEILNILNKKSTFTIKPDKQDLKNN